MQNADQTRRPRNPNRRGRGGLPSKPPRERKEDQLSLVTAAAKETVTVLASLGLPCALFGSLACLLYGNSRYPKDADFLVLPRPNDPRLAEEIKSQIVAAQPSHFYLKSARDPNAPYKILYYRLYTNNGSTCKVDILTPGILHLPNILPAQILWSEDDLPVCPFSLLLLQKLQAWDDHRTATEQHKYIKHQQDAADVRRLLLLKTHIDRLAALGAFPWGDTGRRLFSDEFQMLSKQRVIDYCAVFPARAAEWKYIGFQTELMPDPLDDILPWDMDAAMAGLRLNAAMTNPRR